MFKLLTGIFKARLPELWPMQTVSGYNVYFLLIFNNYACGHSDPFPKIRAIVFQDYENLCHDLDYRKYVETAKFMLEY